MEDKTTKLLIASNIVKSEWFGKLTKEDKALIKSMAGKQITSKFNIDKDGDIEIKNHQSKTLIINKRFVYDC